MKTIFFVCLCFITLAFSCENNHVRSVIIDKETRAEGEIGKDTIYDGLIKFYNIESGRLLSEYTYSNGILNGKALQYYNNGQVAATFTFENGKLNGDAFLYEKNGQPKSKSFFYYDFKSGPSVDYDNGVIKDFWFYSLDGKPLFHLTYDTSQKQKITELISNYFFFHEHEYSYLIDTGLTNKRRELFLYTPNPPNYNFEYSLVEIEPDYRVLAIIRTFDNTQPWARFTLDKARDSTKKVAIRLHLSDSLSGGGITMFKAL